MSDSLTPSPFCGDGPTEDRLRRAEQQLVIHVENTPLAVIEWDADIRVRRWNAQAEGIFGWTAQEAIGQTAYELNLINEENRATVEQLLAEARAGRLTRSRITMPTRTKAGQKIWCEWYISVLTDETQTIVSALSLVLDITQQRATAEALAVSEARMRAALASAKMLAWDLDLVANRWETTVDISTFYGVEPGPDYSNPEAALRAIHPDDIPRVLAGRQRAIATDEPMHYEFRGRIPTADGQTRWFATRGQVVRDSHGQPVRLVAVTTDITDSKRLEAERDILNRQLQDAQRWESLGVLAGGIAHDFNNILTVIMGHAELVARELAPDAPARHHLQQIEHACRRAADVCRQMLAYAGRTPGVYGEVDMYELVQESIPLLTIPARKCTIRLEPASPLTPIRADPLQVRQAIMNLVTNAAEAMGESAGEITIRLWEQAIGAETVDSGFHLPPEPGRYVVVMVSDRGGGIPAEIRSRIFEPFFSTKFPGRGLGLAAVLGIVRAHKGGIHIATTPGQGTSISLYWPVLPSTPTATASPSPPPS
ncbi:MAG: PAS domain S-box protein [Gemmataceae bacterium]|nr:PAS domain S-box protein [Gemmata sp.]MDW8199496.1 PAS domain S-box protein [Gemmataceae bacterium]